MQPLYTLILILALALSLAWHYIRLTRMSSRKIISDYTLRPLHYSLNWTYFILPTLSLGIGLYRPVSPFLISMGATLAISIIVDWVLTGKYVYDAYSISGDTLIRNEFNIKSFDLQELTIIDFLPFSNSLELKFKGGQSLSIRRPDFDNESLTAFLKTAIEKSKLFVAISEDAKSKIYVAGATTK